MQPPFKCLPQIETLSVENIHFNITDLWILKDFSNDIQSRNERLVFNNLIYIQMNIIIGGKFMKGNL